MRRGGSCAALGACSRIHIWLVEVHQLRTRRLFQRKLIVLQRLVKRDFRDPERDVLLFLGPLDQNDGWEANIIEVLKRLIFGLG